MNITQIQEEIAENILLRANAIHEQYGEEAAYEYLNSLTEEEKQIVEAAGVLGTIGSKIGSGLRTIGKTTPVVAGAYDFANRKFSKGQDLGTAAGGSLATTAGSALGAGLGAFGGPLAPVTIPAGAALGALGGSWAYDKYYNIANPAHQATGSPTITVKDKEGKDVKVKDYSIQGGEQGGRNLTQPTSPGAVSGTVYNDATSTSSKSNDRGASNVGSFPTNPLGEPTKVVKPTPQRVPVPQSTNEQRNLKDFRTLQEKIMKKEYEGNVFRVNEEEYSRGAQGTQSGPSISTRKNKDAMGGPKKDAAPIQLKSREQKRNEIMVDNPDKGGSWGADPPAKIPGYELRDKQINPKDVEGGKYSGAPDFSEKSQGRTTTSKSYVRSKEIQDILDKPEKEAAQREKQIADLEQKKKEDKKQPKAPKTAEVPKPSGQDLDKVTKELQKKNPEKEKSELQSKAWSDLMTKREQGKMLSAPKQQPDLSPGEMVRLSLGGPEFYKPKASLKEFRMLQEKIMRKGR